MNGPIRHVLTLTLLAVLALTAGCVQAHPASDTGNTLSPTAVSLPGPDQPLAYEPGGLMYLYWTGSPRTQQVKADMVYRWIVTYNSQRTR